MTVAADISSPDRTPVAAIVLGAAALIPFVAGAAEILTFGPILPGPLVGSGAVLLVVYGQIVLSFLGGAIWGFAVRGAGVERSLGLVAAVLPALWVLGTAFGATRVSLAALLIGFITILLADFWAVRQGLAPRWWFGYRVVLTAIVVPCLAIGLYGSPLV